MEEDLWAAIFADADDGDIEHVILDHLLVDREGVGENPQLFNLDNFSNEEIRENFRLDRQGIQLLVDIFGLPDRVITGTGNNVDKNTAMCMVLRRLTYPNRLSDISPMFGYSPPSMSQIIKTTVDIALGNRGHVLENLNNLGWLDQNKLQYYADAILDKGGAIDKCWAFMDATKRAICRPGVDQQEYYSGHSREHCLKYQSVLAPDGIIVSLKGAWPGRRHDAGMFS